ncbi:MULTISPECIES: arsenic resistance protein [Microbacterium]|uniref:Arsenic resistance protein n=1 Tax=Microbacterium wangchenii TaxID=2541726 RepID=A0ABX5STY4_9MICO|nr:MULTISPECIES: bile acid:sodium symporter [Microbacterium]MCK6067427.1 bile acid:sodium symporter [Microbacterium sp. EYE_512]QBR89636.1 arsenic resistance protein [Microbacterium wangchenii]TXK16765.1 arsenic resistance protein [Microbacterium wangchenii]
MSRLTQWMDARQVPLAVAGIAAGAVLALVLPAAARPLEHAITPVLAALLYVTFLAVPFPALAGVFRDGRLLVAVLVLNFAVVPAVVFGLSRLVAHDSALLIGVLLVLLTPCVDYVIVFSGMAGGDRERLLVATPVLTIGQMVLLPGYLWLLGGEHTLAAVDLRPFAEAFLLVVAAPVGLAVLTQLLGRSLPRLRRTADAAQGGVVPLMALTLLVVVASQAARAGGAVTELLPVVPVFVLFAIVMVPLGAGIARAARLDRPGRTAVVFSGVTRNSLVVLPLALALPPALHLAPLVVVTQTLVELLVMVVLVAVFRRMRRPDVMTAGALQGNRAPR